MQNISNTVNTPKFILVPQTCLRVPYCILKTFTCYILFKCTCLEATTLITLIASNGLYVLTGNGLLHL